MVSNVASTLPMSVHRLEARATKKFTVSNPHMLGARQPPSWFSLGNGALIAWRAIGTIQKSSANHCAGVHLRCRDVVYAKRDAPSHPSSPRPHAKGQSAHKQNSR